MVAPIRWDIRRFEEIDSTNTWVMGQARAGAPEGLVAVADHQTAGRGRLGRTWEAPPGASLLTSVLLRPADLPPEGLHLVTAAVAVAAAAACESVAGVEPVLKWPNDLLLGGAKLAGVLAEADWGPPLAVVVGIGLNLAWAPPGAASLGAHDRDVVLDVLLAELAGRYGDWQGVASEYRRRCATVGQQVRVELADETFTGVATEVTDAGHLLVDVGMCTREVTAGDVVHLRPA